MSSGSARRLVIDASVARESDEANPTTAIENRRFLIAMQKHTPHSVVMTEAIEMEWRQWQRSGSVSPFSLPWLAWMQRKGRVFKATGDLASLGDLSAAIRACPADAQQRQEMLEDLHLVDAARATDRAVVSRDDKVRGYFSAMARTIAELRDIAWVNPDRQDEEPVSWLQRGAPLDGSRCLAFFRP